MEIVNRVSRMSSICAKVTAGDMKIGLVSTMGAIHPGHLSLIQTARKMTDLVVVSIFVNRLQFLTEEEYQKYPRDITKDVDLLRHENVDYVFTPPEEEMYPPDFSTYVSVENYGQKIPGLHRNAYFRGMPTSVTKMIHIVKPAFIFFGQKDGLQGAILRKMIRDLNTNTEVVVTPVVRDASGLAYAARNYFLTEAEKRAAPVIYQSLQSRRKDDRRRRDSVQEGPQGDHCGHRDRNPGQAGIRRGGRSGNPRTPCENTRSGAPCRGSNDRKHLPGRFPPGGKTRQIIRRFCPGVLTAGPKPPRKQVETFLIFWSQIFRYPSHDRRFPGGIEAKT